MHSAHHITFRPKTTNWDASASLSFDAGGGGPSTDTIQGLTVANAPLAFGAGVESALFSPQDRPQEVPTAAFPDPFAIAGPLAQGQALTTGNFDFDAGLSGITFSAPGTTHAGRFPTGLSATVPSDGGAATQTDEATNPTLAVDMGTDHLADGTCHAKGAGRARPANRRLAPRARRAKPSAPGTPANLRGDEVVAVLMQVVRLR